VPITWEDFAERLEVGEGGFGYEGVHERRGYFSQGSHADGLHLPVVGTERLMCVFMLCFSFHRREALFGYHKGGLQCAFLELKLIEQPLGFLVHLLAFHNFAELLHFAGIPCEFEFEALDSLLQNPRALGRPALFPRDSYWIKPAGNRFSALTDIKDVSTVVLAILDFT
jgi:hypothetical protein